MESNKILTELIEKYDYKIISENKKYEIYVIKYEDIDMFFWMDHKANCIRLFVPRYIEIYEGMLDKAYQIVNDINYDIYFGSVSIQKDPEKQEYHFCYINGITAEREGTISQREFDEYINYADYIISTSKTQIEDIERELMNGLNKL